MLNYKQYYETCLIIFLYLQCYLMKESLHMYTLKICINFFFILQSLILIIPTSVYRFVRNFLHDHPVHFNPFKSTHQDVFKKRHDVLKLKGYTVQEFEFETEDHAFVSFWRIVPNHQTQLNEKNFKIPVIIQHGLLDCAMSWFLLEKVQKCLPYLLAKEGYDVWVGNNRGTKYSAKNSHLPEYWEYNVDHLIQYDIPCMIDSVLKQTGHKKLIYIGHSQGTTQLLSALDVHPEIKNKLICFIGLGPIISLANLQRHALIQIVEKLKICQILKFIGFKAMFIIPDWMSALIGILIYNSWFYFNLFYYIVVGLCGKNKKGDRISMERFGVIIAHEPGGSSISNVHQWLQFYTNKRLAKFNHGKKKNIKIYGTEHPPQYTFQSLKNLPFHCHLFRGTSDKVISDRDFGSLEQKLNPEKHSVYQVHDYAHLDYIWSEDASTDIYERIVEILEKESLDMRKSE